MKMYNYLAILGIILFLTSCSEQQARKPISQTSGSFMKESIERNKNLAINEEKLVKNVITKDTLSTYISSDKGYWYTYQSKSTETYAPVRGDIVKFDYQVTDLNGNNIYTKEELKPQTYAVDKQNIMMGLRNGIKLMHKGDKIKFIFPSQAAYGYHGDNNKIGTNQPIICIVSLNEIIKESSQNQK